ncbi:hypothetical protein J437_LFUL009017 [Ladona fulva]|uniref:PiggyBac transposable element-derived protein domain-containing protein n=1 Tax=Ladona fulva TaxID=123851 RepID=A0A8K0KBT2_LADFU|nr:hypothetical protein J437_LFUL009017 [Ladona fulva]
MSKDKPSLEDLILEILTRSDSEDEERETDSEEDDQTEPQPSTSGAITKRKFPPVDPNGSSGSDDTSDGEEVRVRRRKISSQDNNAPSEGDRLHKIRPVIDPLRTAFKNTLVPFQNLRIDESLLLFKGPLFFKQYNSSERNKFGIKIYVICDCETGYILDFIVYTGSNSDILDQNYAFGKSGDIVSTLINPYLENGHNLYVDNWYSAPALFCWLHDRATNACGTVDICILNSFYLYKLITGKKIPLENFHLTLIREMLETCRIEKIRIGCGRRIDEECPSRLTAKHFPVPVGEISMKVVVRRRAAFSKTGKRKESRFMGKGCDVGLCVTSCFENYHTKKL